MLNRPAFIPLILASVSLMASAAITAGGTACTPAARQQAASVVSTVGPALCGSLSLFLGPDGGPAGLLCDDLAKSLAAGLRLARTPAMVTSVGAAPPAARACTPLFVVDVVPGRDPKEFVCVEAYGDADGARSAITVALGKR